jgi:putative ABC transport system permease protein
MRRIVGELARGAPVYDVRTMDAVVSRAQARERFLTTMVGVFAALGLVLAVVGLYGVMANTVAERTREIGVRIALGAQRGAVLRTVIGRGLLLTGIGLLIGSALALAATRVLSNLLYEIRPGDPRIYVVAVAVLAASATVAAFLPARHASRVDPTIALREG